MLYWRDVLENYWKRKDNSFRLVVELADFVGRPGEISSADWKDAEDNDVHYVVDLHYNYKRNWVMYRPIKIGPLYLYRAIYSGV